MELDPQDIIVFNIETDEEYKVGKENTLRVKDLINKLNLLPKIRMVKRNINSIHKSDGSKVEGGHIEITIKVTHNEDPLTNI